MRILVVLFDFDATLPFQFLKSLMCFFLCAAWWKLTLTSPWIASSTWVRTSLPPRGPSCRICSPLWTTPAPVKLWDVIRLHYLKQQIHYCSLLYYWSVEALIHFGCKWCKTSKRTQARILIVNFKVLCVKNTYMHKSSGLCITSLKVSFKLSIKSFQLFPHILFYCVYTQK